MDFAGIRPFTLSIVGGVFVLLVAGLSSIFYYAYAFHIQKVTDEKTQMIVTAGETFRQISDRLRQKNLLPTAFYWHLHARFIGADRQIRVGEYLIMPDDTMATVLHKLVIGDTVNHKFTIIAGWNIRRVFKAMQDTPTIDIPRQTDGTNVAPGGSELAKKLAMEEANPEGWFYPDTYIFPRNTSYLEILSKAYIRMKGELMEAWEQRDDDLPLATPYEALILASIVEKESSLEEEKPRIAGVFISRLNRNMPLQTDPTVIYGIGSAFDGNLRRQDLKTDTPYNTYVHSGLPPTPIAMPSVSTLEAVMNPKITGDLYFVSKGDGSHYFSKTYEAHQKAVSKYQKKR